MSDYDKLVHLSMPERKAFLACGSRRSPGANHLQMNTLRAILLGAVLFSGVCQAQQGIKIPPSALTDEARQVLVGGFDYRLPQGWSRKAVPGVAYKMAFGVESEGDPANISFQDVEFSGNIAELQATLLRDAKAKYQKAGLENFAILNQSGFETEEGRIGAKAVTTARKMDGSTVVQFYYIFERKDRKKVVAICTAPSEDAAAYAERFDAILKTLTISK